ncbi:MAG: hypothetical protein CM1200mP8_5200 [Chloroflexota bacterium]|nr:MAG: hypothetical protein CM1200mP8_5200 [Chloroflexota bacterium]
MSNTLGKIFRITTWGESHGEGVGVVIDGCPAGIPLSISDIETELDRRRPGQSQITTQRREGDTPIIFSGVFQGVTLGTPIMIMVKNQDARVKIPEKQKRLFVLHTPTTLTKQNTGLEIGKGVGVQVLVKRWGSSSWGYRT